MPGALPTVVAKALDAAGVRPGNRIVVAVSGGVDSSVLLHVLCQLRSRLRLDLHVAHVHHGLRGRSADRDATFVSDEAQRAGLPISVIRLQPEARRRGVSVQVWARTERYARLEEIRRRVRATWIVTAHTRNDQAETVLLNLVRGTGLRGLAGIPPVRDRILRPLLEVSRAEVAAYAAARKVAFREDPSNRSIAYRRTHIRHRLLPLLAREYNPRIVESLAGLAAQAREDEDVLTRQASELFTSGQRARGGAVGVQLATLQGVPAAVTRRVVQEAWGRLKSGHGLTRRHLGALLRLRSGEGCIRLPGDLCAWVTESVLWLGPASTRRVAIPESAEMPIRPGRWVRWSSGGCFIRVRRVSGAEVRLDAQDRRRELLSADLFREPLCLRGWRPGDRFGPLGLRGEKKLQDFFVDARVPREVRARIPLLVAGERIAWVVGHRIAEAFRWQGERTACLAEVRFVEAPHGVSSGSPPAVGG